MLQILQYQKTGKLFVADLPPPQLRSGGVLVQNVASVISTGTERSSVATAQASLFGKARSRPDLVRQVLDNVKREGFLATYEKVQNRLDNYKELGYSSAGVVLQSSVPEFRVGDRVACAGVAYHAEQIFVPKHLAAKIPDEVDFESAAFTTIAAIALQGVRQAEAHIGETICVIGVGLLGLLSIQLLKAAGCRVIGIDIDESQFDLARKLGCDALMHSSHEAVRNVEGLTSGRGSDAVIITASTRSSEPVNLAMQIARKRGKVVVVGAVGMEIQRSPFYEKEIDFRISCSYGPGRYDHAYEIEGHDYPVGYVRWTENRNMQAVLDLMAQRKLDCASLISHRFPIADALKAYDVITGKSEENCLAVLIQYPQSGTNRRRTVELEATRAISTPSAPKIGFLGAGNFARSYLLPYLKRSDVTLTGVITATPSHAKATMDRFSFRFCDTNPQRLFEDSETNAVFIATRHESHAELVVAALSHGKHVFVEKPLAVTEDQLVAIEEAYQKFAGQVLMTGFNRRFSQPWQDIKAFFAGVVEPFSITYRVNAGSLPPNHWLMSEGQGGRLIGEVCHFFDCMAYITGSPPVRVLAEALGGGSDLWKLCNNTVTTVVFADGSVGTVTYLANADPALPKEYCEIHCGGRTAIMNNFEEVTFYWNRKRKTKRYRGGKGHKEEVEHFLEVLAGKTAPQLLPQTQFDVTRATLRAAESLIKRMPLDV